MFIIITLQKDFRNLRYKAGTDMGPWLIRLLHTEKVSLMNHFTYGLTMPANRMATIPDKSRPSASMYDAYGNKTTKQDSNVVNLKNKFTVISSSLRLHYIILSKYNK